MTNVVSQLQKIVLAGGGTGGHVTPRAGAGGCVSFADSGV